jgi:hypothetical protein
LSRPRFETHVRVQPPVSAAHPYRRQEAGQPGERERRPQDRPVVRGRHPDEDSARSNSEGAQEVPFPRDQSGIAVGGAAFVRDLTCFHTHQSPRPVRGACHACRFRSGEQQVPSDEERHGTQHRHPRPEDPVEHHEGLGVLLVPSPAVRHRRTGRGRGARAPRPRRMSRNGTGQGQRSR